MADIPSFSLNNSNKIPAIGMGCWMGTFGGGQRVYEMCRKAIDVGYRHFDTAAGYQNEQEVGRALRESGIPRSEFFVTTKLHNTMHHAVEEALQQSLQNLGFDYVDLYLIHWPQAVDPDTNKNLQPDMHPTMVDTWKAMEKVHQAGKVRSIGVSNWSIKTLDILLPHCTIIPVTNQVECHPCLPQVELKAYCESKGIIITAYSPLGQISSATLFGAPAITSISSRLNITPAQILLSWAVQRGTVAIPKSENEGRMKLNITLLKLSEEDMDAIDNIHKETGMHKSLLNYHQGDSVFGWTYEQLGWDMVPGGNGAVLTK